MLIKLAQAGNAKFKGDDTEKYKAARALFPIPSLTMHFVVRADSGIESFSDLEGKTFLVGKGSFGAREATQVHQALRPRG